MKTSQKIVYRYLTDADFFNINKPTGTEEGGGGQSYIDFSTNDIALAQWQGLLEDVTGVSQSEATQGPRWELPVHSVGLAGQGQQVEIYQRRSASITIARQKLGTRQSNRIRAWHPSNGFPRPIDATARHQCPHGLVVLLVKTTDDEVWASWFLNDGRSNHPFEGITQTSGISALMRTPETGGASAGLVEVGELRFDEYAPTLAFKESGSGSGDVSEEQVTALDAEEAEEGAFIEELFDNDTATIAHPTSYSVQNVRIRNRAAIGRLKRLYEHRCQITGEKFLFKKRSGVYYTEVHHLVPLGEGGADVPSNMIVICPQIHSMLHHAQVAGIDLSRLQRGLDGSASLEILINGNPYTIRWKPEHARIIEHSE